jgi:hypothetical protein
MEAGCSGCQCQCAAGLSLRVAPRHPRDWSRWPGCFKLDFADLGQRASDGAWWPGPGPGSVWDSDSDALGTGIPGGPGTHSLLWPGAVTGAPALAGFRLGVGTSSSLMVKVDRFKLARAGAYMDGDRDIMMVDGRTRTMFRLALTDSDSEVLRLALVALASSPGVRQLEGFKLDRVAVGIWESGLPVTVPVTVARRALFKVNLYLPWFFVGPGSRLGLRRLLEAVSEALAWRTRRLAPLSESLQRCCLFDIST